MQYQRHAVSQSLTSVVGMRRPGEVEIQPQHRQREARSCDCGSDQADDAPLPSEPKSYNQQQRKAKIQRGLDDLQHTEQQSLPSCLQQRQLHRRCELRVAPKTARKPQ